MQSQLDLRARSLVILPVSNASVGAQRQGEGSHWSLVLLRRQYAQTWLAEHFDSLAFFPNKRRAASIARAIGEVFEGESFSAVESQACAMQRTGR